MSETADTLPPVPHPAALDVEVLLRQCDVRRSRTGGPGGQRRNKVETAVSVMHRATGISGSASERRSQEQNRGKAIFRLRLNLAMQWRIERTLPWVPTPLWCQRCRGGAVRVNASHEDFPSLLAEALDLVAAMAFAIPETAAALGCTTSQIVKFLRAEPQALAWVNRQRAQRNMPRLR